LVAVQVCNHPYQLPGAEADPDDTGVDDLVEASGKLRMLDRMLAKLKAAGHRVVLFSQFTHTLDLLDDYMRMRGYKYCRLDGSTNRVQVAGSLIKLYTREVARLESISHPDAPICGSIHPGSWSNVSLMPSDRSRLRLSIYGVQYR
jgi:SNF2 family DNA or RNA helicase